MTANITFFPVGNGDMTLIRTESGRRILIDINIRKAADDPDDETVDVAKRLRERLDRDVEGRLFVDAFLLSHPDQDHCAGIRRHFHLGSPSDWSSSSDKIVIRELWSSPMVFRRAASLCEDAKAFNREARRRVNSFRDSGGATSDGDRILILGEDENGKTDDLAPILVQTGEIFSKVNGGEDGSMAARLLGPFPKATDEDEEVYSKNRSSTILQFSLSGDKMSDRCRFLTGGDAEVAIWERLWHQYKADPDCLSYDILQAPHHCSWHSLSFNSWSELGENAKVSEDARESLSQAREGATIVASSNPVVDDDNDPPCIRAKQEYVGIVEPLHGQFRCVGEYPSADSPDTMEFEIGQHGQRLKAKLMRAPAALGAGAVGRQPLVHG